MSAYQVGGAFTIKRKSEPALAQQSRTAMCDRLDERQDPACRFSKPSDPVLDDFFKPFPLQR
jgi:hypothetical protein